MIFAYAQDVIVKRVVCSSRLVPNRSLHDDDDYNAVDNDDDYYCLDLFFPTFLSLT